MAAIPNSAELIGAEGVFADIDRDTLWMDLKAMEATVIDKTKAVMLLTIEGR